MRDSSLDIPFQQTLLLTPKNPNLNFTIQYKDNTYPSGWNGNPFVPNNRKNLYL